MKSVKVPVLSIPNMAEQLLTHLNIHTQAQKMVYLELELGEPVYQPLEILRISTSLLGPMILEDLVLVSTYWQTTTFVLLHALCAFANVPASS